MSLVGLVRVDRSVDRSCLHIGQKCHDKEMNKDAF